MGIAAHHANSAGGGGGGLRGHDGTHEHPVFPVPGLVDQRGSLGPAPAEDDGGQGDALGVVELGGDAGAVDGGGGEAAVGMGALLGALLAVPGVSLPVHGVLRGILVQALPPHGVVVQIMGHIGEDGALPGGGQGIGVGFLIGAGGDAEEPVLRVHSPQPAVLAHPDPGDVVAHAPDLPALLR